MAQRQRARERLTAAHAAGEPLATYSLAVERGKIRELAQAIGDPNPLYQDPEVARAAGYPDLLAPPTFATVVDRWGHADFVDFCELIGLDPVRTLHGEQTFEYHAPVCAGDVLTATVRVLDVSTRRGRSGGLTLVTLETSYVNQAGEVALVGRATWIERE